MPDESPPHSSRSGRIDDSIDVAAGPRYGYFFNKNVMRTEAVVSDPRTDEPLPDQWPQALIARRMSGSGAALADCTLALLQHLPVLLGTEPFCWQLGDTSRARRFELDLPHLTISINRPGGLAVVDRPTQWTTMVQVARTPSQRRESFELSLPGPRERQLLELD